MKLVFLFLIFWNGYIMYYIMHNNNEIATETAWMEKSQWTTVELIGTNMDQTPI